MLLLSLKNDGCISICRRKAGLLMTLMMPMVRMFLKNTSGLDKQEYELQLCWKVALEVEFCHFLKGLGNDMLFVDRI